MEVRQTEQKHISSRNAGISPGLGRALPVGTRVHSREEAPIKTMVPFCGGSNSNSGFVLLWAVGLALVAPVALAADSDVVRGYLH